MRFLTLVAFAILLSFANGAPQMRRHRRHWLTSMHDDPFHPDKIPWKNSCGIRNNDTMINFINNHRNRTAKPLRGLRISIPNYIVRFNRDTQAIDTDDVVQWFSEPFNSTYRFLAQINESLSHIHLRKRHIETQVYVGAFQYLRWKQLNHDTMRNDNINKTKALEQLLILAKNLLCEIETAINNIGMKMPQILTKEAMYNRLTFRNNNRDRKTSIEVDEIDSKFAKIRFIEYLHGLQQILKNRMGKRHQNIQKQKKNPPQKKVSGVKNVTAASAQHSINIPSDNNRNQNHNNHLKDHNFNNSYLLKKHSAHRNNKHRNRNGLGKNIRNRNPAQPTGLGVDDIKHFRRNHRKNAISAMTLQLRTSTTTTSTTTTTPSPHIQTT